MQNIQRCMELSHFTTNVIMKGNISKITQNIQKGTTTLFENKSQQLARGCPCATFRMALIKLSRKVNVLKLNLTPNTVASQGTRHLTKHIILLPDRNGHVE